MKKLAMHWATVLVVLIGVAPLEAVNADGTVELPRDLEIGLALSALPEDLQTEATIYVLDADEGFVVHRDGSNGWVTFVARTSVRFYGANWEYDYPSDQLIPQAHDAVGLAHHVVPYFELEKMRIDGIAPAEAKRLIRERFSNGTYSAPQNGGLSYMLAPIHRAYMEPEKSNLIATVSFPHHMPYAPYATAGQFGEMDPLGRSGFLGHGGNDSGPHGYLYFMVQPDQAEAIREKYADLLKRLCEHHSNWCVPAQ